MGPSKMRAHKGPPGGPWAPKKNSSYTVLTCTDILKPRIFIFFRHVKLALKLDHVVPKPVKLELQNVNIFVKKRNYYMFSFSGREAGLEVGLILAKNREVGTSKCEYIQEKRNHGGA